MSRVLWWLILGLGAWWVIRRLRADRPHGDADRTRTTAGAPAPGAPATRDPVAMVRCAHCGVHLPQSEALLDDEQRSYCSAAHRGAGPR
ncbi:MAG: hypothetical protein RL375_2097 [Pseudomonadota bacterium]